LKIARSQLGITFGVGRQSRYGIIHATNSPKKYTASALSLSLSNFPTKPSIKAILLDSYAGSDFQFSISSSLEVKANKLYV
jgi:hypothetical protein